MHRLDKNICKITGKMDVWSDKPRDQHKQMFHGGKSAELELVQDDGVCKLQGRVIHIGHEYLISKNVRIVPGSFYDGKGVITTTQSFYDLVDDYADRIASAKIGYVDMQYKDDETFFTMELDLDACQDRFTEKRMYLDCFPFYVTDHRTGLVYHTDDEDDMIALVELMNHLA